MKLWHWFSCHVLRRHLSVRLEVVNIDDAVYQCMRCGKVYSVDMSP